MSAWLRSSAGSSGSGLRNEKRRGVRTSLCVVKIGGYDVRLRGYNPSAEGLADRLRNSPMRPAQYPARASRRN
jgi:hypothetical protein